SRGLTPRTAKDYGTPLVRWFLSDLRRERFIMKRIVAALAAGALALGAGLFVLTETTDLANAAGRGGGGGFHGGGGGFHGGGGGMRSMGGGGMRSMGGGGGRAMMRSSVSARHVNVSRRVNTGTVRASRVGSAQMSRVNRS